MGNLKIRKDFDELLVEWVVALPDIAADRLLVKMVAYEMEVRLEEQRNAGRYGWFGPQCSNEHLLRLLRKNLEKGDMIDVINLAGMVLARTKLYGETA